MTDEDYEKTKTQFEKALVKSANEKYLLRLYITGLTPRSTRAIENIKKICMEYLVGRYELEVIDIYQQPERAREAQIIAAPTLIKHLPLPLRKLIGDMTNKERVIVSLDLQMMQ
jgi:circadian clock protein KaiB